MVCLHRLLCFDVIGPHADWAWTNLKLNEGKVLNVTPSQDDGMINESYFTNGNFNFTMLKFFIDENHSAHVHLTR